MSSATKSLLWKEYRETFPILIMILALGLISLFGMAALRNGAETAPNDIALTIFGSMVGIYALAVSALAFVREVDEGRYALLRRFPVSAGTVAWGKVGWILVSILGLSLVFLFVWLLCLALGLAAITDETASRFGLSTLTCAEFFLWGLFWSVRTKKQVTALLSTPAFAVFVPIILLFPVVLLYHHLHWGNTVYSVWDYYTLFPGIVTRLIILAGLAIPTVRGMRNWFDIQIWLDEREAKTLKRSDRRAWSEKTRVRGSFWSLVSQGFGQQKTLLVRCGAIYAVVVFFLVFHFHHHTNGYPPFSMDVTDFGGFAAFCLWLIFSFILTSGIFSPDFKDGENSAILRFAPSPFSFWASRVVGVLGVWLLLTLPLVLFYAALFINKKTPWDVYQALLGLLTPAIADYEVKTWFSEICAILLWLTAIPLTGLWTSAFFRSRTISVFVQFAAIIGLFLWLIVALGEATGIARSGPRFFFVHPFWSVFPLLIPPVAASYWTVKNRLLGVESAQTKRRNLALVIGFPLVMIFLVVPLVRVYSIPLLKQGSGPDDWEKRDRTDRLAAEWEYLAAWWNDSGQIAEYIRNDWRSFPEAKRNTDLIEGKVFQIEETSANRYCDIWDLFRTRQTLFLTADIETLIYNGIHQTDGAWDAENLRAGLELLELIPKTRSSIDQLDRIDQLYRVLVVTTRLPFNDGHSGWWRTSRFPWENSRYRRQLWNARIVEKSDARVAERTIYGSNRCENDIEPARVFQTRLRTVQVTSTKRDQSLNAYVIERASDLKRLTRREFPAGKQDDLVRQEKNNCYFGSFGWKKIFHNATPLESEIQRRFLLVELATLLYYREKEEWPKSVDFLVEIGYLKERPVLPGTGYENGAPAITFADREEDRLAQPVTIVIEEKPLDDQGIIIPDAEPVKVEKICRFAAVTRFQNPDPAVSEMKKRPLSPDATVREVKRLLVEDGTLIPPQNIWNLFHSFHDENGGRHSVFGGWKDEEDKGKIVSETPILLVEPSNRIGLDIDTGKPIPWIPSSPYLSPISVPTTPKKELPSLRRPRRAAKQEAGFYSRSQKTREERG